MFLEKVFSGKNDIGRWIAMILIIVVSTQIIGLIPLGIKIFINMNDDPDLVPNPENSFDLTAYNITPVNGLAYILIPFVAGLLSLLLLIRPIHERSVLSLLTGANVFRWRRFLWGSGLWLLLMSFYITVSAALGWQKLQFQFQPESLLPLIIVSVLLLPFQTGFEEVFFRGYLMQGFAIVFRKRWLPLLVSALLFGFLHFFNPEVRAFGISVMIPQYIWFGIFLGLCVLMDEGLELAWGVHTVNNISLSVILTEQSSAIHTPALFNVIKFNPLIDLFGLIIVSLIFLQIAKRKYVWPGWSYLNEEIRIPEFSEEIEYSKEYGLNYNDDKDEE